MTQKREWAQPEMVELHVNQTLTGDLPIAFEGVRVVGSQGTVIGNLPRPS